MARIKAKFTGHGPDAVKILLDEVQNAFEEIRERIKIEKTLKEQVKLLQPQSFSLGAAMNLQGSDLAARDNRNDNISGLKDLHKQFSTAIYDIESTNPGIDTSKLDSIALTLGTLTEKIERFDIFSMTNAQTQLNQQKKRTAFHRNRATVLRTQRDIAQFALAINYGEAYNNITGNNTPDLFNAFEARLAMQAIGATTTLEFQDISAQLEASAQPVEPENEDDATDATADVFRYPIIKDFGFEKQIDILRKTVEHTIAAAKKALQAIPSPKNETEKPPGSIPTINNVDSNTLTLILTMEDRAKAAEAALRLCKENLQQFQANGTPDATVLDEEILLAYLEMAKSNVTSGQILINRIESLEKCLGCKQTNGCNKRKRCDGCPAGGYPEVVQDLIQRLAEEILPQAELVAKIMGLLTPLRARITSPQSPSEPQDTTMSSTGGFSAQALIQLNVINTQNAQVLIDRVSELESELHTFRAHAPGAPGGGGDDCPKELEKARDLVRSLTVQLENKKRQIAALEDELTAPFDNLRIPGLRNEIAALKAQVEKLKKEKAEVEKRRDKCIAQTQDYYEPTIAKRDFEIKHLEGELTKRDSQRTLYEETREDNASQFAELEAYRLSQTTDPKHELRGGKERKEYANLLAKIKDLKNKLKICEEARGNTAEDSGEESNEDGEDPQDRFEAEVLRLTDELDVLKQNNEQRQRDWIEDAGGLRAENAKKMWEAAAEREELNEKIKSLKDDLANTQTLLKNCRKFRANIIQKLEIPEPEEPRDLEGLDDQTLRQEVVALQRKLTALGVKYEEAVRNDQNFSSDSELDEEIEFQNPRQQIRGLSAALEEVRAKLKKCRDDHEEMVNNPKGPKSIRMLKERIQKHRDERDAAIAKNGECEKEVDKLIYSLNEQLATNLKNMQEEELIGAAEAQKVTQYEETVDGLISALSSNAAAHQAQVQKLEDTMAQHIEKINDLEAELALQDQTPSEQVQSWKNQIEKLKKELKDCKAHAAANGENIDSNQEDLDACRQMREKLQKELKTTNEQLEAYRRLLVYGPGAVPGFDCEEKLKDLEAKRNFELNSLLARIRELDAQLEQAQGPSNVPAGGNEALQAEITKLRAELKNAKMEKKRAEDRMNGAVDRIGNVKEELRKERAASKKCNEKLEVLIKAGDRTSDIGPARPPPRTTPAPNASPDLDEDDTPLMEDDTTLNDDPHRDCDTEIEDLNNEIIRLKQEITALKASGGNDQLEIDALRSGSDCNKKLLNNIDKLRKELADLQNELKDCQSETWQERRKKLRLAAAANRRPRAPRDDANRRMDPALRQQREWRDGGWWRGEFGGGKRRKTA
ncbi:hypothetical protein N431DRAFT_364597 [Stipitochalara longipes BDJ]|nr:hypothetical protein N431DRAFT_364597 [Stipitochalara longipes BDJ]